MGLLPALLLLAGPAFAHGGFPWTKDVVFPPGEDAAPVVVTSFGLLAQNSAGSWTWTCEEVVGSLGMTAFAVVDGRWLAGGVDGLYTSADRCAWATTGAPLDGLFVTDIARDTQAPSRVWVTTGSGDLDNALWVSEDGGVSFTSSATFGEGAALRGFAQGASGLPLVVAGWRDNAAWLWRSEDGEIWTEIALNAPENASIYLLAVDASGEAWLRMPDPDLDRLLRVDTAAASEVLSSQTAITAFDTGPDAGAVFWGSQEEGLRGSSDGGSTWGDPVEHPIPNCLVSHGTDRYVCSHNWSDGAALMRTELVSSDPAGWDWTSALWFGDVHGPSACPAGTASADVCDPLWEVVSAASGLDLERPDTATEDSAAGAKTEGCTCASAAAHRRSPWVLGLALAMVRGRRRVATSALRR